MAVATDEDQSSKLVGNLWKWRAKPEENELDWWQWRIINSLLKPMDSGYTGELISELLQICEFKTLLAI